MSEYVHRITIVVPEEHIADANQFALFIGESSEDINTFGEPEWQDMQGNLYSLCSTVVKKETLDVFKFDVSEMGIPEHAQDVDIQAVKRIIDLMEMYSGSETASPEKIICAIDYEALQTVMDVGLFMYFDY